MDQDIIFDKKINRDHLSSDLQHLPQSIYSALASFDEALLLLNEELTIVFLNTKAKRGRKKDF